MLNNSLQLTLDDPALPGIIETLESWKLHPEVLDAHCPSWNREAYPVDMKAHPWSHEGSPGVMETHPGDMKARQCRHGVAEAHSEV
jgi:hypothetical protein